MRSMSTPRAPRVALGAVLLALVLASATGAGHAQGLANALLQARALMQSPAQMHAQAQDTQTPLQYKLNLAPARAPGLANGRPWGVGPAMAATDEPPAAGAHPAHAYPASAWQPATWGMRPPGVGGQAAATPPGADELQLRLSFKAHKPYEHLRGGQLVRLDLGAATALSLRPRGGRVLVQLHSRW